MPDRDDLSAVIEAHWLKERGPTATVAGEPGICACGAESPREHFDWRVWQWHNQHLADAILAAGWVRAVALAAAEGQVDLTRKVLIETEQAHAYTAADRDRLAATVERVQALCDDARRHSGGPFVATVDVLSIERALDPEEARER